MRERDFVIVTSEEGQHLRVQESPPVKGVRGAARTVVVSERVAPSDTQRGLAALILKEIQVPEGIAPGFWDAFRDLAHRLDNVSNEGILEIYRVVKDTVSPGSAYVGILYPYIDKEFGLPRRRPDLRPSRLRKPAAFLAGAIEAAASSDPAFVHGDIKPNNIVRNVSSLLGDPCEARLVDAGLGPIGSLLNRFGSTPGTAWCDLGRRLACTPTSWGTVDYAPLGRFAEGALPTTEGDRFSLVLSLWEMLTEERLYVEAPKGASVADAIRAHEDEIHRLASSVERREDLWSRLGRKLPDADPRRLVGWLDLFDEFFGPSALVPQSFAAQRLSTALLRLEDPYASPVPRVSEEPDSSGPTNAAPVPVAVEARVRAATRAFEVLVRGKPYSARVLTDFSAVPGTGKLGPSINFEIIAPLGEGAMGFVYRIRIPTGEDSPPIEAALKLSSVNSDTSIDLMRREAVALRARQVRGIAQFIALIELADGRTGLVSEYEPGLSLADILDVRSSYGRTASSASRVRPKGGRLSPDEARFLGQRLFDLLVQLHGESPTSSAAQSRSVTLIHGDLKPGNIIVPFDGSGEHDFGSAVIIDFGVARILSEEHERRSSNDGDELRGGTPGYMPLDHIEKGASPKSDVFAVAATLYEALAGQLPWAADVEAQRNLVSEKAAFDRAMQRNHHGRIRFRDVPLWRKNVGWNRFFKRTLAGGEPAFIPTATPIEITAGRAVTVAREIMYVRAGFVDVCRDSTSAAVSASIFS